MGQRKNFVTHFAFGESAWKVLLQRNLRVAGKGRRFPDLDVAFNHRGHLWANSEHKRPKTKGMGVEKSEMPRNPDTAFLGYAKGDLPLPRAIAEHRFAYSRERSVGMTAPPGATTLDDFPVPLARAFEAAFGPSQQQPRPSSVQWVSLLEEYEQSLRQCAAEKLHHYSSAAANCPWCRMEDRLGVVLFVPSYRSYTGPVPEFDPGSGGFDLAKLWAQITAIKIPARSQLTPTLSQVTAQPSAQARAAKFKRGGFQGASYAAFMVAGLILISVPKFWLVSLGLVIGGFVLRSREVDVAFSLRQRFVAIESQWDTALED